VEPLTVLQAVADLVRWWVLDMLAEEPRCVCKIQEQIPIAGNLLSYHLKVLREATPSSLYSARTSCLCHLRSRGTNRGVRAA
jgi:predicted transcriptional regulator